MTRCEGGCALHEMVLFPAFAGYCSAAGGKGWVATNYKLCGGLSELTSHTRPFYEKNVLLDHLRKNANPGKLPNSLG